MLVAQPARLPDFLASSLPEPKILLDPEGGPFLSGHGGPAAFLIGPEGGLTDGERAAALAHGFAPASLGVIKLKTETAALAALARWAKD
jgi:16S rRNA (uracil1498-N3)-methyltransferase